MESCFHGIRCYTLSFAQAMARNCCGHEAILALRGHLLDFD